MFWSAFVVSGYGLRLRRPTSCHDIAWSARWPSDAIVSPAAAPTSGIAPADRAASATSTGVGPATIARTRPSTSDFASSAKRDVARTVTACSRSHRSTSCRHARSLLYTAITGQQRRWPRSRRGYHGAVLPRRRAWGMVPRTRCDRPDRRCPSRFRRPDTR